MSELPSLPVIEPEPKPAVPRSRVWPVFVTYVVLAIGLQIVAFIVIAVAAIARFAQAHPVTQRPPNAEEIQKLVFGMIAAPSFVAFSSIANFVAFSATAWLACRVSRQSARERLSLGPAPWMTFLFGALVFCAFTDALDCVTQLLDLHRFSITLPFLQKAMKELSRESLLWAIVVSAILPGVGEELFFRGFIQTRLRQRWKPWTAIVVTSILFGILHADPVHSPLAFFMGLVLGWLVERTGSLWVSMFAHVANNSLATLQAHGTTLPLSPANELALVTVIATGAAVLFVQQLVPARPAEAAVAPGQP